MRNAVLVTLVAVILAGACGTVSPDSETPPFSSMEQRIDSVPTPESIGPEQEKGFASSAVERRMPSARVREDYGVGEYRIQRGAFNRSQIRGVDREGQEQFTLVIGEDGLAWSSRSAAANSAAAVERFAVDRSGNLTHIEGPDAALLQAKAAAVVQDLATSGVVPLSIFSSCWFLGLRCAAETISTGFCIVECATVVGCAICIGSAVGALSDCHNWVSQCGGGSGGGGGSGTCKPCSVNRCCGSINAKGCCNGLCLSGSQVCP